EVPLAAIAATPLANSTSPTGRSSTGPWARYIRQPFEIDGRGDAVTVACVGEQFGQQVAAGFGSLDQMMMWVDDRQIGLDDLLAAAVEPVRPDRQMRAWLQRVGAKARRRPCHRRARRSPLPPF